MRIYLTKHTIERMDLRKITKEMVKSAVSKPDEISHGYFGRSVAFKKFKEGVIKIVYTKGKNKFIIISAMWHKK